METVSQADDILDTSAAGPRVVRGGALRVAGYIAMMGLSVGMAAVLTRYLGVARFGQYTTVMSLIAVVALVTDAGMANIGTHEYAVLRGNARDEMLRNLLGLRVALTLTGTVLVAAIATAMGYHGALIAGTVTGSLATVALVFQHTLLIPLTAELRLGWLTGIELARQVLWVGAVVALLALHAGIFLLLSVPLVVNLILIAPSAILTRGRISSRLSLDPSGWPALLRAAIVFSLATAVGTLYVYTAQILTSVATSRHEAGIFAVSFRVFVVMTNVPGLVAASALPLLSRAARDDRDRLTYALQRIFDVSLVSGIGIAIVMSASAGFIVSVVAGPGYSASATVLRIQLLALVASFLLAGWSFALLSLHLYRGVLLANAAALAVSTVATLVLAGGYGADGAAIASICGETTLAVGTLIALARGRRQYRPNLRIVPRVAAVTVCAGVIPMELHVPSIVQGILAAGIYIAGIGLTRATPPELWQLLPWRRVAQ